ncbi:MAG: 4-(cytidine 5'-diphospho)-2-C-methyl-D-erythritol kinase [Bacteroidales bacterium]|nr:4-(cytidine 5'-diphospho)-2-C-methyl-D-erythritol kinase [Bacteroidales bacterium]
MIVFPNAKINIGLNITKRREDGFHDIETIFYPVKLFDSLEFFQSETGKDNFVISGIKIQSDGKKNLVERALDILREKFDIPPLEIRLFKNIPAGAGLGGGSSDAAFFLKAANEYFRLGLSREQLIEEASRLGADCAFFIDDEPKFATGKGNIFHDAPQIDPNLNILIIKPDFGISTALAYSKVKPQPAKTDLLEDFKKPVSEWKNLIKNDFEEFLFPDFPKLKELKERLYANGAIYSSMTGSGSALFGIYDSIPQVDHEIQSLRVF